MIISMIDNQTINSPEDADSILSTQELIKDNEQECNKDDDLETLEMSQCIWDENVCLDSKLIKRGYNFSKEIDHKAVLDKFSSDSLIIQQENHSAYSAKKFSSDSLDDFIIPQIDGTHDTLCQNNDDEKKSNKYPGRQMACNSASSCYINSNMEGSWMQKSSSSTLHKKYDCHNGIYTPFNQATYCAANNSHYTNYSKSANQTGLLMCSQNLSNNINWYSNPNTSYCNPSITYQSSTESNCMPFVSTYRITPMIPENACSADKNEVYRNNLSYSHTTPSTSNYKEFEKTVSPSYKVEGGMKFSTIDTTANLKIFSKDLVFGKSSDCSKNQTSDLFDTLKTNINKVGIQIYPHKFITAKPKSKEVCNMSTQTNYGLVNTTANEEKKTENEKKSNPRTLVVQNMKRLQLSRRQAQQQTSTVETKVLQEETAKTKKVPLTKEKINIPYYPLIHRPAPELNLKMNISNISSKKTECKNNVEKNLVKPNISVTPVNLNNLILPSYIDKKDLVKIGKEKLVLKRLGKNYIDKNCVAVKNNYCSNVLKVTKQSLSALKMRFKMSRIKTLTKELKNSKSLLPNPATNQTKESCLFQSSDLKNVLNPQNDNQEMNHLPRTIDKKKLPLKLTIKLPNLCPIKQTRIRKRKRKNYFKAFQPSVSHKILNLTNDEVDNSSALATSRSKRQNVNYHAHAYSHLLEFDKFVELPGDRRRIFMPSKKLKTADLIKQCKKVEVRLERLRPENLNKMNLRLDKENLSKLLETLKSNNNSSDQMLNSKSYQYVNMYPISVDATNNSSPENYNTGNNDYSDEYSDVMWNLSYLSPMTNVQRKSSPPQCWSPNNNKINNKSVKTKDTHTLKNKASKSLSQNESEESKEGMISIAEESGNTSNFLSSVSSKDHSDSDINLSSFNDSVEKPVINGIVSVYEDSSVLSEKISDGDNDQNEPERQLENDSIANCINENLKIDIETDNNNKEIINEGVTLEIDDKNETSSVNLKNSLSRKDSCLLNSQDIDNIDMNKSDIETVLSSVEESTIFTKEVYEHKDDTSESESSKELSDLSVKVKNKNEEDKLKDENVEDKLEINVEFEDKLEIDDTQDANKVENLQNISTNENYNEEISIISKENVSDEQSESINEEQPHDPIDNSFNDKLHDDKLDKENMSVGSDAENEISSSNEIFSMDDDEESIFLTQKNCSRSENKQTEIHNSSFSVTDELEMLQQKQSSAESNLNDCLQLNLSESSNDSNILAQSKHGDSSTNLSNNENNEPSKKSQSDEEYDSFKESIVDSDNDKISEPEMCLVISEVKSASTDINFDDTLEEYSKAEGHLSSYISSENISDSIIPETQKSESFDLNTTLDNVQFVNNACSLQKDCLPVNMMPSSSNDLDLSPLSPEEKMIYDSEGNIVSANTFNSQYSICLGDHNLNESENQDFPKAVNLHSASILSSYMLMKNKLSKSVHESEENLQISNESQEVLSGSSHEEERISNENVNKNVSPSSSVIEDYTESASAEPISNEESVAKDDESLKDICTQLCNQACLIHNNMLETQKTKNALLVGPFKEVSFVFPTETNDKFYSNKSNLSATELLKVSDFQTEAQGSVIQLNNEKLTCRMCYGTAKNDDASVKIYQCKYCENTIQPFDIKGEEIISDCIKTDVTLKILDPEKTEEIGECSSSLHEEKQNHNESITIQVEENDQELCETSVIVSNIGAEMASESRIQCLQDQEQASSQGFHKTVIKINSTDTKTALSNTDIEKSGSSNSESISKKAESLNEAKLLVSENKCDPSNDLVESKGSEPFQNCENSTVLSFYDDTINATNENQKLNECIGVITPLQLPPTYKDVKETLSCYNLPEKKYQIAYYSNPLDDTNKVMEVADTALKIPTTKLSELSEFDGKFQTDGLERWQNYILERSSNIKSSPDSSFSVYKAIKQNPKLKVILSNNKSTVLTPAHLPPIKRDVKKWLTLHELASKVAIQSEEKTDDDQIVAEDMQVAHSFEENSQKEVSFYRSTPKLDGQKCRKRKRSNSWNGDETSKNSKLSSKRRRLSEDFLLDNMLDIKLSDVFPTISPICSLTTSREKEKVFNKKRKLSIEFSKCELDKAELLSEHSLQPKLDKNKNFHNQIKNKILSSYSLNSDIEGPTLSNNFKVNFGNIQETNVNNQHQFLTTMSMEIHMETREDLRPDPQHDCIKALFYCINNDFPEDCSVPREVIGMIIVGNKQSSEVDVESPLVCNNFKKQYSNNKRNLLERSGIFSHNTVYVVDEICLFKEFIEIVRKWDPDIICGYEIQMLSWGYLIQRAAYLNMNMYKFLSRIPGAKPDYECDNVLSQKDDPVVEPISEFKIIGRVVLNVWKIMRKEVNLNIYTFENVVYHVLHLRIPQYSFRSLTHWFDYQTDLFRWRVIDYYVTRVKYTMNLLNQLDVIGRTSTLARVFGIQFYEVLSRGSQFRVESMMLRTAKSQNYIAVSPSIQQRAHSKAPERFALVMEPESKFYTSPVVVLDFQSLYPSMIIAYNYCYSTCLGRVEHLGNNIPFEFGCTSLNVPPLLLKKLENDILISPNGVAFVKHHIRLGILPKMLEDILNTRIMIKNAMKEYKEIKPLYKLLDARQLGLKLIANVTYGYTSANFSGRMPCVEIADSIVGKARETLEQAIKLIETTTKWNAKVVYGDTDSVFVLLEGRSKEQAFKIGKEIAEAVTAINPKPVKLKFEKVYLPCLLQTKKRYVGYMYETPDQAEPIFDAKGIETIRRDSCPAVGKILEKSLKILFNTKDVSLVKKYVQKQLQKLINEKASLQDYIFAKEYRGRSGYSRNACVPALEIAKRITRIDPRAEPRVGERVPYVVVYGSPGLPLIQLIRQPQELLQDPGLKINSKYYIGRVILPPLHRAFSLIGVDVTKWYDDIPHLQNSINRINPQGQCKGTLSQYFTPLNCAICNELTDQGICSDCKKDSQYVVFILNEMIRKWERKFHHLSQICQTCTRTRNETNHCISLDCPILFKLCLSNRDLSQVTYLRQLQSSLDF
ncbi:uncharacterized protein LOC111615631 [Centruroides sculpturatus]|uniref:uncharacterized protein LOC111615631 n=1 Tax=Centruroides sculpturatus TaxID=218467 RepID=UPI000C6EBCBA|nr:uncharacterized protein LOC111615631 [Centruroides sculpturatus]